MSKLLEMCKKMFEVGCIGFGGGNALIPILEDAFIDDKDNGETAAALDRDVVVANVTPGALPVEIVGSLGRRAYGIKGMFLSPIMFTLPGILGTLILMMLMSSLQESTMNLVLVGAVGISAFICSLLLEYMIRVFHSAIEGGIKRTIKVILLVVAITILISGGSLFKIMGINRTPFFGISTLTLLLAMFFWAFYVNNHRDFIHLGVGAVLTIIFLIGSGKNKLLEGTLFLSLVKLAMLILAVCAVVQSVRRNKTKMEINTRSLIKDILLWVGFAATLSIPAILIDPSMMEFPGRAFLSTLMSFGGGDAYLTIADGMFVDSGMISEEVFYGQVVTVVNVLPGSILCKCLFGMGFYIGNMIGGTTAGIALALSGYACSVAASCAIFFLIYYFYDALTSFESFNFISRWIRPIVVGLLIKVMLGLLTSNTALSDFSGNSTAAIVIFTVVLTIGNYLFRKKNRDMNFILIIIDVAIAMVYMLV